MKHDRLLDLRLGGAERSLYGVSTSQNLGDPRILQSLCDAHNPLNSNDWLRE